MEPHSLGVGDSFDEVAEEFGAVSLTPPVGVLALALQDGDELRTGLEEPTPFADALEDAAEEGGPRAVTVGQQSTMVGTGRLSVRDRSRCQGRAGESVVLGLDRLGHFEVLIGDGAVRDAFWSVSCPWNGGRARRQSPRGSCPD